MKKQVRGARGKVYLLCVLLSALGACMSQPAFAQPNINGETPPNKIMDHPVLKDLDRGEIVNHVGSLAPAL